MERKGIPFGIGIEVHLLINYFLSDCFLFAKIDGNILVLFYLL